MGGVVYTISGIYTWLGTNSVGCDSVATLDLTIDLTTSSNTIVTSCISYTWNGVVYTISGIYMVRYEFSRL